MMMKRNYSILYMIIILGICVPSLSYGQGALDQVINPLERWASTYPQEKVYIHMDKPYYVAGDTLWLKAYTLVGANHHLSAVSGAVYVDLLSDADSLVATLKLPLMAGMAKGNINLAENLAQGNYRIRAYTQWMRNAGPDYFFDELILIGSISKGLAKAHIIFTNELEKNDVKVSGTINFQDANSLPLVDKQVRYQVKTNNELLQTGRAKTDEKGNIKIALKSPDEPDSVNTYILSQIETGKNLWEKHDFPVKKSFANSNVQFFPEGGDLVAGLTSRVAFKAVGTNGLGINIKGVLLDKARQVVSEFSNAHAGMGVVALTPAEGEQYEAEITFPDGSKYKSPLPAIKPQGYVLAAYPQADSEFLLVRVMATEGNLKPVSLLAQSHGEVLFAADVDINKTLTNIRVPLENFTTGIVQLTLFNTEGQPLNERLVFIDKNDQATLTLKTDKDIYDARSQAVLTLNALDASGKASIGNFSISVLDETKVPVNELSENSIFPQVLLKSELKGYIEQPNYYFSGTPDSKDHLDILMMTQGYRRFVWNDLLQGKISTPPYPAEKLTSTISGRLQTLMGKPVSGGKITLFSLAANVALDTISDANGRFVFDNLLLTDSIQFSLQGRTEKNSDKVEILLDGISGMVVTPNKNIGDLNLSIADSIGDYLDHVLERDKALSNLGLGSRIISLKTVNIAGTKVHTPSGNLNGYGRADQIISGKELGSCPTLRMCLEGRLRNVRFKNESTTVGPVSFPSSTRGGGKMLVVIDSRVLSSNNEGDLMDIAGLFDQNMIDPASIVNIELLYSPSLTSIYGQSGNNGVIIINTKGWVPGTRTDYSIKTYSPRGFSNVREFYSPKYGISDLLDAQADMRTTIYWNPTVSTNQEGKATVSFFNAESDSNYRVLVEGITDEGKLGRQIIRYKVK